MKELKKNFKLIIALCIICAFLAFGIKLFLNIEWLYTIFGCCSSCFFYTFFMLLRQNSYISKKVFCLFIISFSIGFGLLNYLVYKVIDDVIIMIVIPMGCNGFCDLINHLFKIDEKI